MTKEELTTEISNIDKQIAVLEQKKGVLVQNLLACKDLTVKERFNHWASNCENEHDWYLQKATWPIAYKILDNRELNRYQTYHVLDLLEEELWPVLGDEIDVKKALENEDITQEDIDNAILLAEELIKGNCISFQYDW